MESTINSERNRLYSLQFTILIIFLSNLVNCGNQSSTTTTPAPVLSSPLIIPSSTLPIASSLASGQLTSRHEKSYVIPVRLKLSKQSNSTKSSSSLLPIETKSNIFRWFPFNRLHRRQSRQTNVQIAVTITLAITAALSAIILALLIALLISIGSLGYAVKKCSFGFGKYLYKLLGSVDEHGHKLIHIIHLITRILNEASGRQHHQTDFLFHLIHIIREIGAERQNQRLLASHEINVNDHGPSHHGGPSPPPDLSSYPGFSDSPRGHRDHSPRHFDRRRPPKSYVFPRVYDPSGRDEEPPLSYTNKTIEYEYQIDHSNRSSHPNLSYQNPYYQTVDSARQDPTSMYDSDQHPNHKYD